MPVNEAKPVAADLDGLIDGLNVVRTEAHPPSVARAGILAGVPLPGRDDLTLGRSQQLFGSWRPCRAEALFCLTRRESGYLFLSSLVSVWNRPGPLAVASTRAIAHMTIG